MTKAVLETTPEIRDRVKLVAKAQGCALKTVTTYIMNQGLVELEKGSLKLETTITAKPTTKEG